MNRAERRRANRQQKEPVINIKSNDVQKNQRKCYQRSG